MVMVVVVVVVFVVVVVVVCEMVVVMAVGNVEVDVAVVYGGEWTCKEKPKLFQSPKSRDYVELSTRN
jgi:hypothetical protein